MFSGCLLQSSRKEVVLKCLIYFQRINLLITHSQIYMFQRIPKFPFSCCSNTSGPKKWLRGERVYFSSQSQVIPHQCGAVTMAPWDSWLDITAQSKIEGTWMHASTSQHSQEQREHGCTHVCTTHFLHSSTMHSPLGNGAPHRGLGLSMSINVIKAFPIIQALGLTWPRQPLIEGLPRWV